MNESTALAEWQALKNHHQTLANASMRTLFQQDPQRFKNFSLEAAGLLLDYSKNRITSETITKLIALAEARQLGVKIEQMFQGAIVNHSEQRPALHIALRSPAYTKIVLKGQNILQDVHETLAKMQALVEKIRNKQWLGYSGKPITDIVNIGIGGSYLGPAMALNALTPYHHPDLQCHFIANIDGAALAKTLSRLNPETTLFIISSKTFTTSETLCNATTAKQWLINAAQNEPSTTPHFLAITAYPERASNYGILEQQILPIWEWVGGRFSLWSAIGFIVAASVGMQNFKELLAGAHAMDMHLKTAPLAKNMPVILALLSVWYINFFGASTHAVLPYHEHLTLLPLHLQQLEMESNGKNIQQDNQPLNYLTAPVIWGATGTNGQHAFHQLLFQGTHLVPVDFIAVVNCHHDLIEHQKLLLANCFAQSQALMTGTLDNNLPAYQQILGNQPSNTLLMPKLTPYTLGALIALYEHKTFIESVIWNINAFDQWGVELGKKLANNLLDHLNNLQTDIKEDSSTTGLIDYYWREKQ